MTVTRLKAGNVDIRYTLYSEIEGGTNKWGIWKNEWKLISATVAKTVGRVNYLY